MFPWISVALASLALMVSLFALAISLEKRPAPKVARLRVEVADLAEAFERLQKNIRRMQMRLNAERKRDDEPEPRQTNGLPDPDKDPEGWKKAMRVRLHGGGRLDS